MENPNKIRDKQFCKSITASLGEIVRYSMNDNFRNSCFELLNVESTKALQEKIGETLNSFCNVNFRDYTPIKQSLKIQDSIPKGDKYFPLLEITPKRENKEYTRHFMVSENRNWLNVAAQQTRNTIRRQSLDNIYPNKEKRERRSNIRCNSLTDLRQSITKTPLRFNLTSPIPNTNFSFKHTLDSSSEKVNRYFGIEKTRKALSFEENMI